MGIVLLFDFPHCMEQRTYFFVHFLRSLGRWIREKPITKMKQFRVIPDKRMRGIILNNRSGDFFGPFDSFSCRGKHPFFVFGFGSHGKFQLTTGTDPNARTAGNTARRNFRWFLYGRNSRRGCWMGLFGDKREQQLV